MSTRDDARPYVINPKGHVWRREDDGSLDIFAYERGRYCNGPACVKCGYGFCHHCNDLPAMECSAVNEPAQRTKVPK